MKIYASSRREDILRRKAEYEADYSAREGRYKEQRDKLYQARDKVFESIRDFVHAQLNGVNINFDIEVDTAFGESIRVRVVDESNMHSDTKSLNWRWEVYLDKESGEIKKESSSWSGLNAVSDDNIRHLEGVLDAVKILNRIDWVEALNRDMPAYSDYVTESNPDWDKDKPNFDRELFEADISDGVGDNVAFKGSGNQYYNSRATCYYKILKETAKQYVVLEIHEKDLERYEQGPEPYRISKDKLLSILDRPAVTVTLP